MIGSVLEVAASSLTDASDDNNFSSGDVAGDFLSSGDCAGVEKCRGLELVDGLR